MSDEQPRHTHVCVKCGWTGTPPADDAGCWAVNYLRDALTPVEVAGAAMYLRVGGAIFHKTRTEEPSEPPGGYHAKITVCGPVVPAVLRDEVNVLSADEVEGIVRGAVVRAFGAERGEALVTRLIKSRTPVQLIGQATRVEDMYAPSAPGGFSGVALDVVPEPAIVWRARRLRRPAAAFEIRNQTAHAFPHPREGQRAHCGVFRGGVGQWPEAGEAVRRCRTCARISGDGGVGGA